MPLIKSGSRAAMSQNIREMVHAGHPQKQAIAAAYRQARQYGGKFQAGGDVDLGDAPLAKPDQTVGPPLTLGGLRAAQQGFGSSALDALNPFNTADLGPSDEDILARESALQRGRYGPGKIPSVSPMLDPDLTRGLQIGAALPAGEAGLGLKAGALGAKLLASKLAGAGAGEASRALMLGPMGMTQLRLWGQKLPMPPVVRSNLPGDLVRSMVGLSQVEREAKLTELQAALDERAPQILEDRGRVHDMSDRDIWNQMGWFRGADQGIRREVPDTGGVAMIHASDTNRYGPLVPAYRMIHPSGIDFHDLYKIPHIAMDQFQPPGHGAISPGSRAIWVGGNPYDPAQFSRGKDTSLHEVQHAIQLLEGFGIGSAPEIEKAQILSRMGNPDPLTFSRSQWDQWERDAYEDYMRSAGEAESRNVQHRYRNPMEYYNHPADTADRAFGAQIVRQGLPGYPAFPRAIGTSQRGLLVAGPGLVAPIGPSVPSRLGRSLLLPERKSGGRVKSYQGGGGIHVGSLEARGLAHSGMIKSTVPGRTDKLPITVGGGAYVLPADHMAAIGQGNSMAGADIMNKMLKMGPYASSGIGKIGTNLRAGRAPVPKLGRMTATPKFAAGGQDTSRSHVPIVAAGGEFVVPPEKVAEIGSGDMDRGHKILDHWVVSTRKKHIKDLRGLKPPKK